MPYNKLVIDFDCLVCTIKYQTSVLLHCRLIQENLGLIFLSVRPPSDVIYVSITEQTATKCNLFGNSIGSHLSRDTFLAHVFLYAMLI